MQSVPRRTANVIAGDKMIKFKLKEYLQEQGLSLYWLAKETGIRYATIHDIANNKTTTLNLYYLYVIVNTLGIKDMNLLFEVVDDID